MLTLINIAGLSHRGFDVDAASTRKPLDPISVVGIACFVTAVPILTHLWLPPLAVALGAFTTVLIAAYVPSILPAVLVFSYLFQNSIVSLVSPWLANPTEFGPIRGYSFLATAVAWLVSSLYYWRNHNRFDTRLYLLMIISGLMIGLIGFYFVYGMASSGSSAIIYLRNVAGPLFMFQIFAISSQRCKVLISGPMRIIAALLVAGGYVELFFRDEWLSMLNGRTYWRLDSVNMLDSGSFARDMLASGRLFVDIKDIFRTELFNTIYLKGLNLEILRLAGPNYHPISYGYALAFMIIYSMVQRAPFFMFLALPLLVFASAKGAMLVVAATMLGLFAIRILSRTLVLGCFAAGLGAFALLGIVNGLRDGDYHVAGFFGGIAGFIGNPLGHGLGSGGNLTTDFSQLDWQKAQALGQSATAVESAVGVLLYQMGVAAFALLATYVYIALAAWRRFLVSRSRACAALTFSLAMILVNGIFQEEALFAPLALGLLAGYAGIVLGGEGSTRPEPDRRQRSPDASGIAGTRRI